MQAPEEDDPTVAIVTGPSSSGPGVSGVSPSGSQVELSKVSSYLKLLRRTALCSSPHFMWSTLCQGQY